MVPGRCVAHDLRLRGIEAERRQYGNDVSLGIEHPNLGDSAVPVTAAARQLGGSGAVTDDDVIMTAKIARAHLNEFPDYYTRLAKMEAEAEADWTTPEA